MERRYLNTEFQQAVTGFLPGAFLFLVLVGVGFPLAFSRGDFTVITQLNWKILVLEIMLLTGGFLVMALLLTPKRLTTKRWRAVLAGIGAVILLAVLSIFTQGSGLFLIMAASLLSGMLSTFSLVVRHSRTAR